MPEAETGEDKTLDATPRRRQQAREEGRVAKSTEVNTTVMLLAGTLIMTFYARSLITKMGVIMRRHFEQVAQPTLSEMELQPMCTAAWTQMLWLVWPILFGMALAGVVANL